MQTVMQGVLSGADQAIGNTPLIELQRLCADLDGTVLAKCEFMNPGGSKKDRIAKQMIDDAEARGLLSPGQTIVEVTSGNTGCGLAIVCAVRGYRFVSVMSQANSVERVRMMKVLGAEVLLVDQASDSPRGQVSPKDLDLVEEAADDYVKKHGAVRVDQFRWESNKRAHYDGTGREIWEQSDGQVDAFVEFVGTGGTFAGVSAALKERNPGIRCYIVEPASASYFGCQEYLGPHRIAGGGYARDLALIDHSLVEDYVPVDDDTAIKMARRMAGEEGLFVGTSSGANTAAAMKLLSERERGSRIVVVLTDTGLKYLSTPLFEV
ncbi:MAG: cysteine synthase family protein [Phycisphaerales bacterium]|nr:MAG: cysteine synthase family protein [Phycisphaerales bacterium]